jgi:invasion protein IalB
MTVCSSRGCVALLVAIVAIGVQPDLFAARSVEQAAQPLPGGATSLQELHGDWRVACVQQEAKKVCALSQQQTNKDTGQLLLAIELQAVSADRVEGTLILPFGLALERPITFEMNGAPTASVLRVRTCLPVGCLVSLSLDPATINAMRKGTTLTIRATADGGGQEALFAISLNGFSSALERTVALAR